MKLSQLLDEIKKESDAIDELVRLQDRNPHLRPCLPGFRDEEDSNSQRKEQEAAK